jgi:hypothetical protein
MMFLPGTDIGFYKDADGKIWLKQKGGGGEGVESGYKVENGEVVPDEPAEGGAP